MVVCLVLSTVSINTALHSLNLYFTLLHNTVIYITAVCMNVWVITYSKGKVANSARGQLNRENKYFPVLVRARDIGFAGRVWQSRPASAC